MPAIERMLAPRTHDVGGLFVGRVLPQVDRRMVGPFIFLDHIGPADMRAGQAVDVRPHPHIGLSTLTYLFEGKLFHRDNLGNAIEIVPGEVNWMTAGRGIAHSERTSEQERKSPHRLHGLQCWVALPKSDEETAPGFSHHAAAEIPRLTLKQADLRIIAGEAFGMRSPVKIYSPLFYVDVHLEAHATIGVPDEYRERALYVIEGKVTLDGVPVESRTMAVLNPETKISIYASSESRFVLLGGEPFPERRHIWWNFVSSSEARIDQAKDDWKAGRFGVVTGDEKEFIPLPE